ncbi:MAG: ParB/RepB/Spo0J family partition protein [Sedimentisphaerales bacterium]|nr:ParB/RepB/Spo0J family partition protein [Sedimentisphaerales bacterium]
MKENYSLVPLGDIVLTKNNPRQINQKSEGFIKLTDSIRVQGVIVPIHIRNHPGKSGKFELLAGERRYLASLKADKTEIRAINHGDITDEEAFEITFAENFAREDLTPVEQGSAVGLLMEKYKGDHKAVAARLGKSEKWVHLRNCIHTQLSEQWKEDMLKDDRFSYLTTAHLGLVARLPESTQKAIATRIKQISYQFSVNELEKEIADRLRLLSKAPFDTQKCGECTKRSGAQPGLWSDNHREASGNNDKCLDGKCWDDKEIRHNKRQLEELKKKYPGLVCVETSYCYEGDIPKKLRSAYGKYLASHAYDKSKKKDKGSVPALVVYGSGKGGVIYVKIHKTSKEQKKEQKPEKKTLKQLRAELRQTRWQEVIGRLIKKIKEITPGDRISDDAMFTTALLIVVIGCDCNIYSPNEKRSFLESTYKIYKTDRHKARVKVFEKLWLEVRDDLHYQMDCSGNKDSIKAAGLIASIFDINLDEIYRAVCNEPGFEEPPAWKNLKADGTPKKAKTGKATKKKKTA